MPRHVSTHFAELNFALSKINSSYVALCLVCGRYLKNTAAKRILAHRNICKESDTCNSKTDESSETVGNSDNISSQTTRMNHLILHSGRAMRSRGTVWKFFDFDKETKRVTCKYCDKQYKRNATRMQEHLNLCPAFQTSEEKIAFEIKHRNKDPDHVQVVEDSRAGDSPNEDDFDTDLIRVEHKYNSMIPPMRSHVPLERRYSDKSHVNYSTYGNEEIGKRDEFDVFGEHVANELRKIKDNAVLLANTKLELNGVLHKAVIESLKTENFVSVVVDNVQSS